MNYLEKEAIEQLKSWRKYIINNRTKTNQADYLELYIGTILNLIEKLKNELDKKDNVIFKTFAIANNCLYFNDSADYGTALWEILKETNHKIADKLDKGEDIDLDYIKIK